MHNTYEEIKLDIENVYKWFFDNVCTKCNKECQHNGRRGFLCPKFQEMMTFFANEKAKDNKNKVIKYEFYDIKKGIKE